MTPERFKKITQVLNTRQPDLTVVMENVSTPHNLAAIARTCDAVGIPEAHAITRLDAIDLKQRAASGTRKWIKVNTHPDIDTVYALLRKRGLRILTAHLTDDAVSYRDVDYTIPTALIVGTELEGISDEAVEKSDGSIMIPMLGMVQSLNVSVATALILYEAQKQREKKGMYGTNLMDSNLINKLQFEWSYPKLIPYYKKKKKAYPEIDSEGYIKGT